MSVIAAFEYHVRRDPPPFISRSRSRGCDPMARHQEPIALYITRARKGSVANTITEPGSAAAARGIIAGARPVDASRALSIVVPLHNESASLARMHTRLSQ